MPERPHPPEALARGLVSLLTAAQLDRLTDLVGPDHAYALRRARMGASTPELAHAAAAALRAGVEVLSELPDTGFCGACELGRFGAYTPDELVARLDDASPLDAACALIHLPPPAARAVAASLGDLGRLRGWVARAQLRPLEEQHRRVEALVPARHAHHEAHEG